MHEDERQVAAGGVLYRGAGCLLLPFLPVKAAGLLLITTRRILFDPIMHYKILARKESIDLHEVQEAEASGGQVEMNLMDFVNIGKLLSVRMKSGKVYKFRSTTADELAEAINRAIGSLRRK